MTQWRQHTSPCVHSADSWGVFLKNNWRGSCSAPPRWAPAAVPASTSPSAPGAARSPSSAGGGRPRGRSLVRSGRNHRNRHQQEGMPTQPAGFSGCWFICSPSLLEAEPVCESAQPAQWHFLWLNVHHCALSCSLLHISILYPLATFTVARPADVLWIKCTLFSTVLQPPGTLKRNISACLC